MAFSTGILGQQAEINVTPLIDVLLVLLIIFMVIVPVRPRGLDSRVPQPGTSEHAAAASPLVIEVLAPAQGASDARIRLNTRDVSAGDLRSELAGILAARQDRTVFVRADRTLAFDAVAHVVAAAHDASAAPVGLLAGSDSR